jgi:hypothetical protein
MNWWRHPASTAQPRSGRFNPSFGYAKSAVEKGVEDPLAQPWETLQWSSLASFPRYRELLFETPRFFKT